jgi:hypothetical protein
MLRLASILTFIFFSSCGSDNGSPGKPGEDGDSANCFTIREMETLYLVCKNPDGSTSKSKIIEGEGKPGEQGVPGEDAISKNYLCAGVWTPAPAKPENYYAVRYSAVMFTDGSSMASLKTDYHTKDGTVSDNPVTVLWPASAAQAASGFVETILWSAELIPGEMSFKFKPKNSAEVTGSCE